jgi:uncharacterized protein YerC
MIPECGCWIWMGALSDGVYGSFLGHRAHRASWELYRGEIPVGLCVLHNCHTPLCVNPNHLRIGTKKENTHDAMVLNRQYIPKLYGEMHASSKLSQKQVEEIRLDERTHRAIAKDYGICHGHISEIKNNHVWKHLKSRIVNCVHRGKLNADQVISIRNDTRKNLDIAIEYGISNAAISRIKNLESWKNL